MHPLISVELIGKLLGNACLCPIEEPNQFLPMMTLVSLGIAPGEACWPMVTPLERV
jgi:hypothetical protein